MTPGDRVARSGDDRPLDITLIIRTESSAELQRLREAVVRLRSASHRVRGYVTFESGDGERFAKDATSAGADLILAAGGDGTVNEVVNGILAARAQVERGGLPTLGIIPIGTANDLASWLGIPEDIDEAIASSLASRAAPVDVASANHRYFLNVSTGGFGAQATVDAPDAIKRTLGTFAYVITGVKEFATLSPTRARFTTGEEVIHDGEFLLFAVGNGARTGGGNWLTPRASITDGLLDLCIVRSVSHREFLGLLPDLRSGEHVNGEQVVYRQVPSLTVRLDGDLQVNLDGESMVTREVNYRAHPGALRLAAPRLSVQS